MNIQLGNLWIGHDYPCRIIAECCQNHMGDLATALEMARQAQACGVDIAKFQHPAYDDVRRRKYALDIEEHKQIKDYCESIGIEYLCTPFDMQTAEELNEIGVKGFKIGSRQSWGTLTNEMTKFNKPLIITFNGCITGDILLIKDNLEAFGNPEFEPRPTGFSCHSPTIYPAIAAIALGAKVVEKHVILDKNQVCADQHVSIDFNQLKELVDAKNEIGKLL